MGKKCKAIIGVLIICLFATILPVEAFAEEEVSKEESIESVQEREEDTFYDCLDEETDPEIEMNDEDGDPGAGRLQGYVPDEFYEPMPKIRTSDIQHADKFDGYTIQRGIDVSQWNGDINWERVKQAGVEFAFIRTAYRGYGSSGTLCDDPNGLTNIKNAVAAGIPIGVYIFSQATTESEAQEEAAYILDQIKEYKVTLPIVIDFEYASDTNGNLTGRLYNAHLSREEATDVCMAFCDSVASAGYTPMVYANYSMFTDQLNASVISDSYPIWLAHYTNQTSYTGDYDFWQYSATGSVDGIDGDVDMDFWYIANEAGLTVTETTLNSISLRWNEMDDVSGYDVYRKNSDGNYEVIGSTSNQSEITYKDTSLTEGTAYSYKVCAYTIDAEGNRVNGSFSDEVTGITMIQGTDLKGSASGYYGAKLTWSQVAEASGYKIQRFDSESSTYTTIKTITDGSTVSYVNTNLNANTTYKYRIRAYKTVNGTETYSLYSDVVSVKTKGNITGVINASNVNVRSGAGTSYKCLTQLKKSTKVTVTGSKGSWYRVSITLNGAKETGYISSQYVTLVAAPSKTTLTVKASGYYGVKISWKKVTEAAGYQVQRYDSSSKSYKTIKDVNDNSVLSYKDGSLNAGVTYKYRIRAYKQVSGAKVYGSYSVVESVKTFPSIKGKVTGSNVNARKGPGTSYKILKSLKKNSKILITGSRGSWYRISITNNGKKTVAYVLKKYVKLS